MTLYKNREKFSKLSAKLGRIFGSVGLTANNYTAIALLLAVVSVYFLFTRNFLCAAFFFAIASFFDIVDGSVARYRKEVSRKGAYLDTISDRYMEGIFVLGIMLIVLPSFYLQSYFWAALYLFGSMMTTYAKSAAAEKDLKKELRGGLLERADRLIILFVGITAAYFNAAYLTYVLVILALLSNISALQRIQIALKGAKP